MAQFALSSLFIDQISQWLQLCQTKKGPRKFCDLLCSGGNNREDPPGGPFLDPGWNKANQRVEFEQSRIRHVWCRWLEDSPSWISICGRRDLERRVPSVGNRPGRFVSQPPFGEKSSVVLSFFFLSKPTAMDLVPCWPDMLVTSYLGCYYSTYTYSWSINFYFYFWQAMHSSFAVYRKFPIRCPQHIHSSLSGPVSEHRPPTRTSRSDICIWRHESGQALLVVPWTTRLHTAR